MNAHATSYLVHFSNVLTLVSYSVRDILWLRWFAVAAALTNIPYFLAQPETLWPPVMWALVFTTINLFQITRIYLERRRWRSPKMSKSSTTWHSAPSGPATSSRSRCSASGRPLQAATAC